jgi:pyruvate dehydrogenase E1 component alpha subunit
MHLFDYERRFLGGYGIVGGNLPLAAGVALAADYRGENDVMLCMFGDGATNQGTFGETMNLAALWKLPVVFMVINNQFGMGTALERHSAVTDLSKKAEGFGVPGSQCDGMDVLDTHAVITEAVRCAREERRPQLVEAVTYRFRGHSMADPEEYRTKEEVEEWRKRDPIETFGKRKVDEAVKFADKSPFPELDSLYDHVYVYGEQVKGWYTVDERSPDVHPGEDERDAPEISHRLAKAGASYAGTGDQRPEDVEDSEEAD